MVACLHTAGSNVAVFDAALAASGLTAVRLRHHVRPDLLRQAEAAGGLTPSLAMQAQEALRGLAQQADAVLLTCSSLGPVVEEMAAAAPVLRTDAALARAAVRGGGRVVVLCAVPATLGPTGGLFRDAARATGAAIEVRLLPGAWDAFTSGDLDGHLRLVARIADTAAGAGVTVTFAQASVAAAADLASCRPLAGPGVGLAAAAAAARHR